MKRKEIKNYDADAADVSSVASFNGATGLMLFPPQTDSEFASLEDIQTLETPKKTSDGYLPNDERRTYPKLKKGGNKKI